MASKKHLMELELIAELRAHGRVQGWSILQIVDAIVDRFGVSRLKAHRLARGWTRRQAAEAILATYDADGLARPSLTVQRLCAWEHDLAFVRARTISIGCAGCMKPARTCSAMAATTLAPPGLRRPRPMVSRPSPPPVLQAMSLLSHTLEPRQHRWRSELATTVLIMMRSRRAWRRPRTGASFCTNRADGMAVLLDQAAKASAQLSGHLEEFNVGPVTIEHLQPRLANFVHNWEHTPSKQLFGECPISVNR
jgi:hypothetical protein